MYFLRPALALGHQSSTNTGRLEQVILADFELISVDEAVRSGLFPADVNRQLINLAGEVRMFNTRVRNARTLLQTEIANYAQDATLNTQDVSEQKGYLTDTNVKILEESRGRIIERCKEMLNTLRR
jgi:hypothetical protein